MSKFVKLPESKIVVNVDHILFIGRKDINLYVLFMRSSTTGPMISGVDLEALEKHLAVEELEGPPKVAV